MTPKQRVYAQKHLEPYGYKRDGDVWRKPSYKSKSDDHLIVPACIARVTDRQGRFVDDFVIEYRFEQ